MPIPRLAICTLTGALLLSGAGAAFGQDYPVKLIRIVTSPVGGGNDLVSRLVAQGITGPLGQPVIVDNRAGVIPGVTVSRAPADGYSLLLQSALLWLGPLIQKTPFDPVKDFAPISLIGSVPNILVVHPALPVNSVRDLIALAKARPGEINCAMTEPGASNHVAMELFKSMAAVNLVRIKYKGTSQALNDLIAGQVQVMFGIASLVTPHVKSGRLKAIAITTAAPSSLYPELPTVAATGLPGYESVASYGMFAPAKTPEAIIKRLNQEVVRFLHTAEAKERFLGAGAEIVASSPEQLATTIKSEMDRVGKVIRDAGIRAD